MRDSSKLTRRIIQAFVLIILATGALIVLFVTARLYVDPPDYLPPTIDPFVPSVDLSITVTEDRYALISGSTNLPEGTLLMVGVLEEGGYYASQEQVSVENGHFQSGQLGPEGGLNFGSYQMEALTLSPSEQPEPIRTRFGPDGVNLVGNLIVQEDNGAVVRAVARFEVVRPAPVLRDLSGPGIGQILMDYANGFEITLQNAYKAKSAFGIEASAPANKEYSNEFVLVEFIYKNMSEKERFVSYVDFILFVNEEFALTDLNTPFTYYPDGRFTVLKEAKEYGFFSIQEVLPGESFTGIVAFMVPDISHKYVFSANATSCIEQEGTLRCFGDFPTFEFND